MPQSVKVYVQVTAVFSPEGLLLPRSLVWEDGRRYVIDQVVDHKPAAATRAGGHGERYTVRIGGRESYLFFERLPAPVGGDVGRWFVERRLEQPRSGERRISG